MGTAWERYGMCKSALRLSEIKERSVTQSVYWDATSTVEQPAAQRRNKGRGIYVIVSRGDSFTPDDT
jgi:hypothetical protein